MRRYWGVEGLAVDVYDNGTVDLLQPPDPRCWGDIEIDNVRSTRTGALIADKPLIRLHIPGGIAQWLNVGLDREPTVILAARREDKLSKDMIRYLKDDPPILVGAKLRQYGLRWGYYDTVDVHWITRYRSSTQKLAEPIVTDCSVLWRSE